MAKTPENKPVPKEKQPVAKEAPVLFESNIEEPLQYDVCGIRAHRDQSGKKCRWRVPADMVERFSRHTHVISGRIARLPEKKQD